MRSNERMYTLRGSVLLSFALAGPVLGQTFHQLDGFSARGASPDGSMVLGSVETTVAGYWTPQSGYTVFGDRPGFGQRSRAFAASSNNRYIVGETNATPGSPTNYGLYRYDTVTGEMEYYGYSSPFQESVATGVSDDGEVISFSAINHSIGAYQAMYWTRSGGLRPVPGVFGPSAADGMSADGRVIVGNGNLGSGDGAFRWSQATGAQYLESLDPTRNSRAFAINSTGEWSVGTSYYDAGDFDRHDAIVWQEDRILRRLPVLDGYTSMRAFSLSDDASIVGGLAYGLVTSDAFIWTAETGTISLRAYLVSFGVNVPDDFPIANPFKISSDGRTFSSTVGPAYAVTIPAPATTVFVAAAALASLARRKIG